jgi:hypothetical protein
MKAPKIKYKMVRLDEGTYKLLQELKIKLTLRDKLPYYSYEIIRKALEMLKERIEAGKNAGSAG